MAVKSLLYRGLEIYPLVFPRRPTVFGRAHNYDDGFDAAVRIHEPNSENTKSRSRVFRLSPEDAYASAGDARRAGTAYAEQVIDTSRRSGHSSTWARNRKQKASQRYAPFRDGRCLRTIQGSQKKS